MYIRKKSEYLPFFKGNLLLLPLVGDCLEYQAEVITAEAVVFFFRYHLPPASSFPFSLLGNILL
jgi:hypothetical protein